MRSSKDIEKIVRDGKPNIQTSNQLDKLIIDGSYSAMDETVHIKSQSPKFSIFTLLLRNKIAIGVTSAVIILIAGFLLSQPEMENNIEPPKVTYVKQTPAEMLSTMSLIATYRQGGIEAMENQMDKAVEKLEPLAGKVTIEELLEGFNDS
jgi:hypothetical protein